jgi:hypothetical protein
MRIELVVRPIAELRLVLGRHNQSIAFNDRGDVVDIAPWFLRLDAEKGSAQGSGDPIAADRWTRVTIELDDRERRLFVDGRLRHLWKGDFAGLRGRLAIGPRKSGVTVRSLSIEPLSAAG